VNHTLRHSNIQYLYTLTPLLHFLTHEVIQIFTCSSNATHTLNHSLTRIHTYTHTSPFLTHSLTHSLTHTGIYIRTYTYTHIHTHTTQCITGVSSLLHEISRKLRRNDIHARLRHIIGRHPHSLTHSLTPPL
jgi:hypothetical protein